MPTRKPPQDRVVSYAKTVRSKKKPFENGRRSMTPADRLIADVRHESGGRPLQDEFLVRRSTSPLRTLYFNHERLALSVSSRKAGTAAKVTAECPWVRTPDRRREDSPASFCLSPSALGGAIRARSTSCCEVEAGLWPRDSRTAGGSRFASGRELRGCCPSDIRRPRCGSGRSWGSSAFRSARTPGRASWRSSWRRWDTPGSE